MLLEVEELDVRYGKVPAVRSLTLNVDKGENRLSGWSKRCRQVDGDAGDRRRAEAGCRRY
jgi:hypothetical protein